MRVICRCVHVVVLLLGIARIAAPQGAPSIRWMRGGHQSPITRIAYSSDGTFFATGGYDWSIKIWRASDAQLLRTILVPNGATTIALSPDDTTVCAGASNASSFAVIRCYHVADGAPVWSADVPGVAANVPVDKLAFSPDGSHLAAAVGVNLPIFNAANGLFITDYHDGTTFGGGLAYSPDGQFLAVGHNADTLALLNASTGALVWDTGATNSAAADAAFSGDSQFVATANPVGLHVFNVFTHAAVPFEIGMLPPWQYSRVTFSPDSARIATGYSGSSGVGLFDTATGHVIRQWNAHGGFGYNPAIAFSADSTKLISGYLDIKRWNASNGNPDGLPPSASTNALLTGQYGPVWRLALSANDAVVATATASDYGLTIVSQHVISLFRASDGGLLRYIDYGATLNLAGLALSPDGHHVAASDHDGLRVWNVDTGALEATHGEVERFSGYRPLAYTPDGTGIVEGADDISLWNPTTDAFTTVLAGPATSLRFLPAPDGRLVVVKPDNTTQVVTLAGHVDLQFNGIGTVVPLAVSPDGTMIAEGGVDGAFSPNYVTRIWRVSDGATLQTLVGHTNVVSGVAFSWDSRTIVTGDQNATVRIWRVSDGTQLHLYDDETYNIPPNPSLRGGISSVVASTRSGRFIYGRVDATIVSADNPEASPAIATFDVPADLTGSCKAPSGKVVLDRAAPPAGLTVSLSSSSPDVSVPASLTFKSGVSKKTFKINTTAVAALETATITATLGGQVLNAAIDVHPIGVASITLTPVTVVGGTSVNGTVTLECDAPDDVVVTLSSSIPSAAQPSPATVTIPPARPRELSP